MTKILFLLLSIIVATTQLYATPNPSELTDANIAGHVINTADKQHIPFATIRILNSNYGTNTDATGHYFLKNLPNGKYKIEASCIGYISQTFDVSVIKGKLREVNFSLSEDVMQLEQVVVTGSKSETTRRLSPTLINVVGKQTFELVNAASLADGLNFQPGVRVEDNCQNCGFTQVRINGLDGHYSQILMNSRPVFSALTGVYGLEQIPACMIDRVEVMRGGGSALFGSSAIGGTINIITKDPVLNTAEVTHNLTSLGVTGALDNNTTFNASMVNDNQRLGLFIFGQNRNRDGFDYDGDGFTESPKIQSQTIGTRVFMRPSNNTRLTAEYRATHEFRRGGDSIDLQPHKVQIAEQIEHTINGADVNFNWWDSSYRNKLNIYTSLQDTNRKSYYGGGYDDKAYGRTTDLTLVSGSQYTHEFDKFLFMPSELIGGLEFNYNRLKDETPDYFRFMLQNVYTYSGYLQNEWKSDKWGFLIGARADKNSFIDNVIISPRANIRFNPTKEINFRASYSTGFRAPQAFDEDLHIAFAGGERQVITLAKDLKQENSNSFSVSGDFYHTFGKVQTNILVEGFYTHLSDVFALREIGENEKGEAIMERYNGSGANVMGINLEAKVAFPNRISLQGGLTLQSSKYSEPEQWSDDENVAPEKKMFRTPDCYAYLTASYNPIKPLTLALTGTYTGSMLVQHKTGSGTDIDKAVSTPSFADVNFKIAYDFKIFDFAKLQLNAGIINIFNAYQKDFDKGGDRDSNYIYGPTLPRSLSVGLKLSI